MSFHYCVHAKMYRVGERKEILRSSIESLVFDIFDPECTPKLLLGSDANGLPKEYRSKESLISRTEFVVVILNQLTGLAQESHCSF